MSQKQPNEHLTAVAACTLDDVEAEAQLSEWRALRGQALTVVTGQRSVQMTFPATALESVADLVRREAACCSFLALQTSVDGDVLTLDISSENPDAQPVLAALAGDPTE